MRDIYLRLRGARWSAAWVVALTAMTGPCLALGGSGASVDEAAVRATVTVDQARGSDAAPGTAARPVRTVRRGFELAGALLVHEGVRVLVRPGVYREELGYGPSNLYKHPFVFQGTDARRCVLTGADRWAGWAGPDANGVYSRPWLAKWGLDSGFAANGEPAEMRRYENVVVDGVMSLPVLSAVKLKAGTFFVDEAAGRLRIRPPAGVDLNAPGRDVEVTTRAGHVWNPAGNRRDTCLLHFFRSDPTQRGVPANVVVRGLTFQDAAAGPALYLQNITNALVEDCRFLNCGYSGLGVSGNRITVRRCDFAGNGSTGFGADGDGILIQDCLTTHNCAKGHAYGWDGWDSGGFKCGALTHSTVRRLAARDNLTKGMWFDTACLDDLVEDCVADGNSGDGLFWENNNRNDILMLGGQVTGLIRHCRFTHNGNGFFTAESENVVLDGCRLVGNGAQVGMYNGTNPPRGILHNVSFENCVIAAEAANQVLFSIDDNAPAPSWTGQFLPSLRLDPVFCTDHNRYSSPSPVAFLDALGKRTLTFAQWQAMLAARGQNADRDSIWRG